MSPFVASETAWIFPLESPPAEVSNLDYDDYVGSGSQEFPRRFQRSDVFFSRNDTSYTLNPPAPKVLGRDRPDGTRKRLQVYLGGGPFFGQNLLFLIGCDARLQKTL